MTSRISDETRARIAGVWPDVLAEIAAAAPAGTTLAKYGISGAMARAFRAMDAQADKDWQLAREESANAHVDAAISIALNPALDSAYARVAADIHKWAAARFNPRMYGDRAQVDVNVRTLDMTQIILAANARLAASRAAGAVIDGTCERVPAALADLL